MYNLLSFRITKEQYKYLLPVLRTKLLHVPNGIKMKTGEVYDLYAFSGTKEDYADVLNRCKYLDADLLAKSLDYKERLEYNQRYNSGLTYKRIHH